LEWVSRGARLAVGAALVIGSIGLAISAGRVLLLVLIAVILAAGLEPLIAWIRRRLGLGRGKTILLVYGAFLVAVVGLATVVLPTATSQLADGVQRLPAFFERIRGWATALEPRALATWVTRLVDAAHATIAPRTPSAQSAGDALQVGLTVVETIVSVITILTVVYYWLIEHARLQRYALAFVPADRRPGVRRTWNEVETRLGLWVRGQLILMGTIGIATGTACALLGVPGALVLGLISALTEAIPLVGPFLGAVPAVVMAATVSPQLALTVAGVYVVLQVIEGNVLVPIVMRNSVGISPFLVVLSILIGGTVGGLPGAFLAVPVVATIELLIESLQAREKPVAQDPTGAIDAGDDGEPGDALGSPTEAPILEPLPGPTASFSEPAGR
jgi:predicted PurR-regulated permease PerM